MILCTDNPSARMLSLEGGALEHRMEGKGIFCAAINACPAQESDQLSLANEYLNGVVETVCVWG